MKIRLPNLSSVTPLLSAAAPFIPGLGPLAKLGIGAIDGLVQGSDRQRKASSIASQQQAAYNKNLTSSQANADQLHQLMLPLLQQHIASLTSDQIPQFDNRYRSAVESNAPEYDNAVHQTMQDFGGRGLGVNSSTLGSAVGNIRAGQAASGAKTRGMLLDHENERRMNGISSLIPTLSSMRLGELGQGNQALAGIGGLGGLYQSQSDATGKGLGDLGSLLPLLLPKKNPAAGNNTLGTNQVSDPWSNDSTNDADYGFGGIPSLTGQSMPTSWSEAVNGRAAPLQTNRNRRSVPSLNTRIRL